LLDLVKAVFYLIDHSTFDSPNNCSGITGDPAQQPTMTKRLLAGPPVKGCRFPLNAAWYEWASDSSCLPTEEDYLEETRDAIEMKNELDQKDSEILCAHSNAAASEDEKVRKGNRTKSSIGTIRALSDTTSDVAPSYTKIRYAFDPEDGGISWDPYAAKRSPSDVESQRILIWHPHNYRDPDTHTVFYFIEYALSPLSPLLNLMHHSASTRPRLSGILWMTPLDAISPFYHVPISVKEEDLGSEGCEGEDGIYPSPICLRFLAVMGMVTNWVAWFSRMESYTTLGPSRFHPALISASVAACLLQPLSLGCG
uniref:Uncharacterized protein n=1 Tax=Taenia asiatica TaxID=60517 RepID=A0A0R3WGC1_TAEAS